MTPNKSRFNFCSALRFLSLSANNARSAKLINKHTHEIEECKSFVTSLEASNLHLLTTTKLVKNVRVDNSSHQKMSKDANLPAFCSDRSAVVRHKLVECISTTHALVVEHRNRGNADQCLADVAAGYLDVADIADVASRKVFNITDVKKSMKY